MKIYVTRHGETQWNREGRLQGWKNSNLTQNGIENAKKLGESLKDIDFDCIYCSPLGRAVDTANYIRGDKDTKIITVDELREMNFGSWEGMEHARVEELYTTQSFNLWNKPHLYEPIDGESFQELFDRVNKALNDIIKNSTAENVLLVSHAVVIKAIYATVKGHSLEHLWDPPYMKDTCLTILEAIDDEVKIVLEADVSHLD